MNRFLRRGLVPRVVGVVPSAILFLLTLQLPGGAPPADSQPETPERVRSVSLVPSLGELIVALGEAPHLVARTDFDTHDQLSWPAYFACDRPLTVSVL